MCTPSIYCAVCIHFNTHQNCKFATQQLGAERLLIRVDIYDALFDSRVLFLICDDRDKAFKRYSR